MKIQIEKYNYKDEIAVIRDIAFELEKGLITSFIGPSGCGKSTLLRVLMGMETGAYGNIFISNFNYKLKNWNTQQKFFSMVPQTPYLFPWKNIFDNILLAVESTKSKEEKNESVENVLSLVQLSDHAKKYPHEISIGMAQRVAFARALVLDSKAILLDEPFASLDAHNRRLLQEWLHQKIQESQKYAILVTHDIREAMLISQTVHVLQGSPTTIHKSFIRKEFQNNEHNIENEIFRILGTQME